MGKQASKSGKIRTIFQRPEARGAATAVSEGRLIAGQGLEGDRYAARKGSFSKAKRSSNLTLISVEDLDHVARTTSVHLSPEESLRNLVTEGIDLTTLLHRRFQVGEAVCVGTRLCEPCTVLEEYTGRTGLLRPYVHRTGLRAQVLESGSIRVGDPILDLGPAEELMATLSAPSTGRGVHLRQPDGAFFCGECESPSGNPNREETVATCLRCGMKGPIRDLEDMPWDRSIKTEIAEKMNRFPYRIEDLAKETGWEVDDVRAVITYARVTDDPRLYSRVAKKGSSIDFDDRFTAAALERIRENAANLAAARRQFEERLAAARS